MKPSRSPYPVEADESDMNASLNSVLLQAGIIASPCIEQAAPTKVRQLLDNPLAFNPGGRRRRRRPAWPAFQSVNVPTRQPVRTLLRALHSTRVGPPVSMEGDGKPLCHGTDACPWQAFGVRLAQVTRLRSMIRCRQKRIPHKGLGAGILRAQHRPVRRRLLATLSHSVMSTNDHFSS